MGERADQPKDDAVMRVEKLEEGVAKARRSIKKLERLAGLAVDIDDAPEMVDDTVDSRSKKR